MRGLWQNSRKENTYFYSSTTFKNYKRSFIILFLFTFLLICDAKCQDLVLQDNFNPERFFVGTWHETNRLNQHLTNWAKCLRIDSYMVNDRIQFTTSAFVPFLYSRQSFKSSTKINDENKANFFVNISFLSLNASIISTDYDNYAVVSSCFKSKSSHRFAPPQISEIVLVFRRNKNDKGHVEEIARAAEKMGISYKDLYIQNC